MIAGLGGRRLFALAAFATAFTAACGVRCTPAAVAGAWGLPGAVSGWAIIQWTSVLSGTSTLSCLLIAAVCGISATITMGTAVAVDDANTSWG